MIVVPQGFEPLVTAADDRDVSTLAFRGPELLVRESDFTPAEESLVLPMADPARIEPVGRWRGRYYRSVWLDPGVAAPAGHRFAGLRGFFGRAEDEFVAIAGRAAQLAEWAR